MGAGMSGTSSTQPGPTDAAPLTPEQRQAYAEIGAALAAGDRPEWIHCVGTGYAGETRPWCGSTNRPFFVDATHAALNGRSAGRLVACHECVEAIIKALRNGH